MASASISTVFAPGSFRATFKQLASGWLKSSPIDQSRKTRGRPPQIEVSDLIMGLVFHCLQGSRTLGENIRILMRKKLAESSLSERRQNLPWEIFTSFMQAVLAPKATQKKHPLAFYKQWRLVAMDGTQFSASNTPQVFNSLSKAASRRMKAAFAKIGMVMLVELGIHNPLAAVIGKEGESELAMAKGLLASLPENCLLIGDRLYGVASFLVLLKEVFAKAKGEFLVRVRSNLQVKVIECFKDGSALVEARASEGRGKILVREIRGRVRRPGGSWVEVRFWTSLLDWKQCAASELVALYARRWEQELVYKQLKVDMRQANLLKSQTVETAAQEIAALVVAHAILAEQRMKVAKHADDEVLSISFGKTLVHIRALWLVLAAGDGVLYAKQQSAMSRKVMKLIAEMALPKRRKRTCPRALRQPVSSWPRLIENTYSTGATEYQLTAILA